MERNSKPAAPVSSQRDDETRAALVLLLRRIGWDSAQDPDHARLTAALPQLRALLAPPALPGGGNAYPVETQQAHVMAIAATHSMPQGPEQELAYTLAMARAMAGATLLDVYAGQAMQGMLGSRDWLNFSDPDTLGSHLAREAFALAQCMLAERERRHG